MQHIPVFFLVFVIRFSTRPVRGHILALQPVFGFVCTAWASLANSCRLWRRLHSQSTKNQKGNDIPCFSKKFECVCFHQLCVLFEKFASSGLSEFRKHCRWQNQVTSIVEKAKNSLDNNEVYGVPLMDLSKAFLFLPYRLLILELHAYGLSSQSCKSIASFFSPRGSREL